MLGTEPKRRSKQVVVIARPYCSPDRNSPNYEQYCHQSFMQHKFFRQMSELLAGCETYAEAYATFLQMLLPPLKMTSSDYSNSSNKDSQKIQSLRYA